jgi:hypothetical protein
MLALSRDPQSVCNGLKAIFKVDILWRLLRFMRLCCSFESRFLLDKVTLSLSRFSNTFSNHRDSRCCHRHLFTSYAKCRPLAIK